MNKKIVYPILIFIGVVAFNILSNYWHFRIDLTSENRYTLSDVTKSYADSVDQNVSVVLYLNGDLNPGFRRLRRQTVEMCDELGYHLRNGLRVLSVNPSELSKSEMDRFRKEMDYVGLDGVPVFETKEDGQKTRSVVYPYAKVCMGEGAVWVNLLDNVQGLSGEESLARSIEAIEYKLTDAIARLARTDVPKVAFLEGHGELSELDVMGATARLAEHFQVDRGEIRNDPHVLDAYKVIIIAKPSLPFSEKDKFVLDQYVMRGGRLLWFVDAVNMTLDTLRNSPHTIGLLADLNLDDLLFGYGVRIKPAVVEDLSCGMIPISVPTNDGRTQIVPMPWVYGPLLGANMACPVTRNVSRVRGDFVSPIDTVGEHLNLKRTPLLRTSSASKLDAVPVMASLSTIHQQPNPQDFSLAHLSVALLEEGVFNSAFARRRTPAGLSNAAKPLASSVPTKMIVVSDGDIVRNDVRFRHSDKPSVVPLGYDEISRQTFGNADFVVNAVQFLADDAGLMELRNRNFALRLLDRKKISEGTTTCKVVALLLPMCFIALLGGAVSWSRKRLFSKK